MTPDNAQKLTMKRMPELMDTLRQDPLAMEIFLDELALADQTQPKHLRFLANLPQTSMVSKSNSPIKALRNNGQGGIFDKTINFNLKNASNIFDGANHSASNRKYHDTI